MIWPRRRTKPELPPAIRVLSPDGVEPRGFHGKNAFADQANLLHGHADVIFDVGANTGQTTAQYLTLPPTATIYAFEPYPPTLARLVERFAGEPRVRPQGCAVADTDGPTSLRTFSNDVTNSLLPAAPPADEHVDPAETAETGAIPVEATTLDNFCRRQNIERIDILKLDVQGGELLALRGAQDLLGRQRVRLVYLEVCFVPVYAGQAGFHEVAARLAQCGYGLFDFYNFTYAEGGQVKWGDALFRVTADG